MRTIKIDGQPKTTSFWSYRVTKMTSPVLNKEYKMPSRRRFAGFGTNAREDELQCSDPHWNQQNAGNQSSLEPAKSRENIKCPHWN